jgi:hypothetical protein
MHSASSMRVRTVVGASAREVIALAKTVSASGASEATERVAPEAEFRPRGERMCAA